MYTHMGHGAYKIGYFPINFIFTSLPKIEALGVQTTAMNGMTVSN